MKESKLKITAPFKEALNAFLQTPPPKKVKTKGTPDAKMKSLAVRGFLAIGCLFSVGWLHADYFYDKYTDQPQVLLRIVNAAQRDSTFRSYTDGKTAFYLKRAEYIGPLQAPFGIVEVATLFFIRSSPKGSKIPPVGDFYIIYFDSDLRIRSFWKRDMPDNALQVNGTKLLSGDSVVFDYAKLPAINEVLYDGKVLGIPTWRNKRR